ncbi:Major facilitator superfamily domain general substrate transporter [Penicillium citrinum]|uniref:Major facilitator superfamily domain general substrate transporter n=2 Tax=Penicillium TaxID=5073 RepID=A0A9W9P512_PENCI|nr:Major facilitator superfamily domain general substrate transporter [Penicillium citrinum]KAJ5235578.1 Major facilitator superfamily domain general substrate transporter [Penicillium citrinum]KAJ5591141.1 Major facilitator superfamily domain general substrate transporter [Penicillium hetheringtonii]
MASSLDEQKPNSSPSTINEERELPNNQVDLEKQLTQATSIIPAPKFPETDLSQGLVGWDSQDDPENPQNFAAGKKWALLALISAFTLISPLASSMFSPAVVYMAAEFHETNETILSFTVSIYLVGYVFGPLFLAPLSEIFGRRVVLSAANWFFVVWQIGCALAKNIETLIVCRLFAGIGGSACITLGAGVVADLFPIEMRGRATSIWSMGPLIGPVIGPIAGGFLGEEVSWQWIFWLLLIAGGAMQLGIEILNKETYAPVLIKWKTAKLAKELGRTDLKSAYDIGREPLSDGQILKRSLVRPVLLLFKSPIVSLLSLYMSLVYGLLYLFFTTISDVFTSNYGFTVGLSGLAYLGIGIGFFVGLMIIALTNDRIVKKLTSQNNGKFEPEMRLPTMIMFSCILPISFFWYGWTADKHVFWLVPIIGMFPFGVGMMGVFMPIQTYIIDCYPAYAASANATLTATRSLVGAFLPLAGPAMFKSLGLGWGNSLLGFLALAFVPLPIIFTKFGKQIREKWPVDLEGSKK